MQSIYFFRDADTELFARTKANGLEIPNSEPLALEYVPLTANFRTTAPLVYQLNEVFTQVFSTDDGSGVTFSAADPFREDSHSVDQFFKLHISFGEQTAHKKEIAAEFGSPDSDPKESQSGEIVEPYPQLQGGCGKRARISGTSSALPSWPAPESHWSPSPRRFAKRRFPSAPSNW